MEPCPCNHQEQEVLPVLSQLCAQSMLNNLWPWTEVEMEYYKFRNRLNLGKPFSRGLHQSIGFEWDVCH